MKLCIVLALVLIFATSAFALEKKAYQMRDDFGTELQGTAALRHYYHMSCPEPSSNYWAFTGWDPGDIVGHCFTIGDQGTGGFDPADPGTCHELECIRVLDFAGYGTVYPGLFTIELDVYCGALECCYAAPLQHIWNSGPLETHFGWNFIYPDPYVCLSDCAVGPPYVDPYSVIVTMTMTGPDGVYPALGFDNPGSTVGDGCLLHDYGCMTMTIPRYACGSGMGNEIHSGYVGTFPFEYWPMQFFCDGLDTTLDCSQFGAIELAWTLYFVCDGPTANEPSSWGNIKSMYR